MATAQASVSYTDSIEDHIDDWVQDGTNLDFPLVHVPDPWSVEPYLNGLRIQFTAINGSVVTLAQAPEEDDELLIASTSTAAGPATIYASAVGIANRALLKIGANQIDSYNAISTNAAKVRAIYPYIIDWLMQQKDWRFAKLQVALTKHSIAPQKGYQFAYVMPSDFLRLCMSHYPPKFRANPFGFPSGYWSGTIDDSGYLRYYPSNDPPVFPGGFPFAFEVIPGDRTLTPPVGDAFCLLTNYDNTAYPIIIDYIRRSTDPTKYTPLFIECFASKMAAELAIPITESLQKKQAMEIEYGQNLLLAEAANEFLDYIENETGTQSWATIGR